MSESENVRNFDNREKCHNCVASKSSYFGRCQRLNFQDITETEKCQNLQCPSAFTKTEKHYKPENVRRDSNIIRLWHFPVLKNSNMFRLYGIFPGYKESWHFQILTFFGFWNIWKVQFLTSSWCLEYYENHMNPGQKNNWSLRNGSN